jgi:hypothetical protein
MGVVPLASLLRHPGIRLPEIEKVTLPATETEAVIVVEAPFVRGSATVRVTAIGEEELFVIVRLVIDDISLPA